MSTAQRRGDSDDTTFDVSDRLDGECASAPAPAPVKMGCPMSRLPRLEVGPAARGVRLDITR
jgi:hypothetical protein